MEILTNPSAGYFFNRNGKLSSYSIWHEAIGNRSATPLSLEFTLFERLELVSMEEMTRPHSILIADAVPFEIYLPPRLEEE